MHVFYILNSLHERLVPFISVRKVGPEQLDTGKVGPEYAGSFQRSASEVCHRAAPQQRYIRIRGMSPLPSHNRRFRMTWPVLSLLKTNDKIGSNEYH